MKLKTDNAPVPPRDPKPTEVVAPAIPAEPYVRPPDPALNELSHPANWQSRTPNAPISTPAPVTSTPQSASFSSALKTAIKSAEVTAGIGAVVVNIGTSVVGMIGQAIATAWTLRNILRPAQTSNIAQTERLAPDSWLRRGFVGMVRDLVLSPAFNMAIAGAAFAVASGQALVGGVSAVWQGFAMFFVGQMGVTYLGNKNHTGERTNHCLPERLWRKAWSLLPSRIESVLLNAGLFFSAGNLRLVLGNLGNNLQEIASSLHALKQDSPLLLSGLVLGTSLAGAGIARGLWPLVSPKTDSKPSALPLYLAGAASGVLGLVSLSQGHFVVGAANLIWMRSNWMFGTKQKQEIQNNPSTPGHTT